MACSGRVGSGHRVAMPRCMDTLGTVVDSMPDLSTWLTKTQAATRLGTSVKTIERLARRKQLRQRTRQTANSQPAAVYDPAEVERIAEKRGLAGALVAVGGAGDVQQPGPADATKRAAAPAVRIERKVWLTVREAAAYSGLPLAFLRESLRNGDLRGRKFGGSWRVRRNILEAWEG
jgi:excisionase family DNA binding protein